MYRPPTTFSALSNRKTPNTTRTKSGHSPPNMDRSDWKSLYKEVKRQQNTSAADQNPDNKENNFLRKRSWSKRAPDVTEQEQRPPNILRRPSNLINSFNWTPIVDRNWIDKPTSPNTVKTHSEVPSTNKSKFGLSQLPNNTWEQNFMDIVNELEAKDTNKYFSRAMKTMLNYDQASMNRFIKKMPTPMDFQIIRRKFNGCEIYYKDPWDVIQDIYLVFDSAKCTLGPKTQLRDAKNLLLIFENRVSEEMELLGYCCGRFDRRILFCQAKKTNRCVINFDEAHFVNNDVEVCGKCYFKLGNKIKHPKSPKEKPEYIYKKDFYVSKNKCPVLEPFVECRECKKRLHQCCVLYHDCVWPEGFICSPCMTMKNWAKPKHQYFAKNLKHTTLSRWLEERVENYLAARKAEANEVIDDVVVRVLSSGTNTVKIKDTIKNAFPHYEFFQNGFPYRAKAIFAFQMTDGEDVCFFGMHVQEYGTDSCHLPNRRCVYLAYIDSVAHFSPRKWKTDVYHELILGYLEFAKRTGYTKAYIWACPPGRPEWDYIFRCHPPDQKIPDAKRLQKWYGDVLEKGVTEGIVQEVKFITDTFAKISDITDFTFFHDDLMAQVLEKAISEMQAEEAKLKQKNFLKNNQISCERINPVYQPESDVSASGNTIVKLEPNKLLLRVKNALKAYNGSFFVVHLQTEQDASQIILHGEEEKRIVMVENRDEFLQFSKDNNWEFSTMMKAKFSTLSLIIELSQRDPEILTPSC